MTYEEKNIELYPCTTCPFADFYKSDSVSIYCLVKKCRLNKNTESCTVSFREMSEFLIYRAKRGIK